MALKSTSRTTGGERLNDVLRKAKAARGVNRISVGIQGGETYDDAERTPVAMVGFWNNFGTDTIPARPFAQQGNARIERGIGAQIRNGIDPQTMVIDRPLADRLGEYAAGEWQQAITDIREPPNAEITVHGGWMRSKTGKLFYVVGKQSTNPLINNGRLRKSVSWQVD